MFSDLCAVVFFSTVAFAGPVQYQVTGPVLEVTDTTIVVQKGNDKWEIARDKATAISGDLKVGIKGNGVLHHARGEDRGKGGTQEKIVKQSHNTKRRSPWDYLIL